MLCILFVPQGLSLHLLVPFSGHASSLRGPSIICILYHLLEHADVCRIVLTKQVQFQKKRYHPSPIATEKWVCPLLQQVLQSSCDRPPSKTAHRKVENVCNVEVKVCLFKILQSALDVELWSRSEDSKKPSWLCRAPGSL